MIHVLSPPDLLRAQGTSLGCATGFEKALPRPSTCEVINDALRVQVQLLLHSQTLRKVLPRALPQTSYDTTPEQTPLCHNLTVLGGCYRGRHESRRGLEHLLLSAPTHWPKFDTVSPLAKRWLPCEMGASVCVCVLGISQYSHIVSAVGFLLCCKLYH